MIRLVFAICIALLSVPATARIKIEEVVSPGGIKARFVNEPSIPFVSLAIGFRGGASLDPDGKVGVTSMMTALLEEGTGDLDARGFAEAAEALAAKFRFETRRDSIRITAEVLTENRDAALALLRRAIVEPAFTEDAISRVRARYLAGIEQNMQTPRYLAGQRMSELSYPGHAYSNPVDGTLASITALTRDDLVEMHRRAMSMDHLVVSAVGDITAEELGRLIDHLAEGLPGTGVPLPPDAEFAATGGVSVIEIPTPQSTAVWAHPGLSRDDPDFMAAFVMNHILGGGFGSRLMTELRVNRGLTYGVYSYFVYNTAHSVHLAGAVTSANGTVAEVMNVIRTEWDRMATEGVTEEELEIAKKNLTGSYALRFDGNTRIAGILQSMQIDNFPDNYVNIRNDLVRAVTVEDIRRVASEMLDTGALRFVVAGQPEGLVATDHGVSEK
ncbi:MAG: insulinase family protein [Rhodobacteraceae bacterium]|nr:insulinase family protein [Paracoccaceae bacterium]